MSSPQEDLYIFEQRRLSGRIYCSYLRPSQLERIYDEASKSEIYDHKIRPNKKINVFRVTRSENLSRVGTHTFSKKIFREMHKIIFFSRKPEKI